MASFDLALQYGCDGFEFDVRMTADGQPVICHDPRTRGVAIARAKGAHLRQLPSLRGVLIRYQDTAFLDIELKVAGVEKTIANQLRKFPPARGCVVSSFLPDVLRNLHEEDASIPLGLICETRAQLALWSRLPVAYVIPHQRLLRQSVIGELQEAGKKVLVWTVNSRASMKKLAKWQVEGIVSDKTELLVQTVR